MSFVHEKRVAARLLAGLEDGHPPLEDLRMDFEDADPALVALIFRWLRAHYHAGHSASEGVLGRVVSLCQMSPRVAQAAKAGERDVIVEWFVESHDPRSLDRDTFISLVVEKLEG
jgi:hypothetical protein